MHQSPRICSTPSVANILFSMGHPLNPCTILIVPIISTEGGLMKKQNIARMLIGGSAIAFAMMGAPTAFAQNAPSQAEDVRSYSIAAGSLASALNVFANETGLALVYPAELVAGLETRGFSGRSTPSGALASILSGSGLVFRFSDARTVVIERSAAGDNGERVLGAVRIEGAQGSPYFGGAGKAAGVNGINGSRDITATEGTGSFTSGALTIGSKVAQALKDVPQSISLLTSERLKQQNVTDFTTAMRQLPGVTLVQGNSSLENIFYSRGFAVTSIQVDGGAPLTTTKGYFPQIDMSIYDHVELVRGASGLFNGYGNPSGVVNLVRKKPLDHPQYVLDLQAGSWSNYRVVADATAPLALDGKLRGRLVMTYQNNHYFYDTAKDNKSVIYGIVELDATPTTTIEAGINYTKQNSSPWLGGLPRYQNGSDLKLPRSTCLCFSWNRQNFDTTEIFGIIEQKLGDDWNLKFNVTKNQQSNTRKIGWIGGGVNSTNLRGPLFIAGYYDYASSQLSAEFTMSGGFTLFGQRQEVTIGANRVNSDAGNAYVYGRLLTAGTAAAPYQPYAGGPLYYSGSPNGRAPSANVLNFNPLDPLYTEPHNILPDTHRIIDSNTQLGAYINVRLTAFDRLHLTTGFRWSRWQSNVLSYKLCTVLTDPINVPDCYGRNIGDTYGKDAGKFSADDTNWPPPVSLSFDITKNLNIYASYTDIYINQDYALDASLKPLNPITGSNWEGGVKWAPKNGKINFSLSAYRVQQKGFAAWDGTVFKEIGNKTCCFIRNPNRSDTSSGIDLDITGEILPGWQIAANYTYDETKQEGSDYGTDEGKPLVTIQPKHLYKIWTTYNFGATGASGALSGLSISGGVNGQSSGYQSGAVCVNFDGHPNPVTGAEGCVSGDVPDYIPFEYVVPSYAVFSGRIDYRISKAWSLAINLENILDKTYYQTTGVDPSGGNWYGAPRSVTASLRAKW
jgi:outer-membrane receptor for ferric coprogen and ferric-rhodotorulic acid